MRICLYTATALPKLGGQEAVVDSLARHFVRMGHEPVVLAPKPRRPLVARDGELPYPVVRHPRFVSTRDFVSWYRVFLQRVQRRYRFDLIHCHDVYPTGYLAGLCKSKLGIPLAITSHGGDVRENNPRLERGRIPQRMRMALQAADVLVSIAPFTEKNFRRLYPEARRIVTIPNGIDLAPYQASATRPAMLDSLIREGKYVFYLGRLAKRKGVDVLLRAMTQVPAGDSVQLVIAGTGDDQAELKTTSHSLGLTDRVRFVGRVEGNDKVYLLQNAIATVMPSRVWEAFPLVVLETFAAGRPIIGTRVPGIADLIEDGKTGFLFADEDWMGLAQILRPVFADPNQCVQMGAAARQVAKRYSWDSVAAMHIELYRELVGLV
ncbi:MAG TPA: glycosyltransferase family 4 protein [Tepidisphaeraceae bacterium]|jgi:glycosyltransferase involved in cell wall biosynthesis